MFQGYIFKFFQSVSTKCSRCFKEVSYCMALVLVAANKTEGGLVVV